MVRGDRVAVVLPPTPEAAAEFVRERLSTYAYPREIEFTDELPKTLTGKIRRIELRERSTPKR